MFISIEKSAEFCRETHGMRTSVSDVSALVEVGLLPVFRSKMATDATSGAELVLKDDLESLLPILSMMAKSEGGEMLTSNLFDTPFPSRLSLDHSTHIDLAPGHREVPAVFYPAARNLITWVSATRDNGNDQYEENGRQNYPGDNEVSESSSLSQISHLYFSPSRVSTSSKKVWEYVEAQQTRAQNIDPSKVNDFVRSADYMGSKRALASFLVEAIAGFLPPDGTVIDIMCGAGAASSAFGKVWRTVASDAQNFCQMLAVVQGSGYSQHKAEALLQLILPVARDHASELRERLRDYVKREDEILHGDINEELLARYQSFIGSFPAYSDLGQSAVCNGWCPKDEVAKRQQEPSLYPYCLFTTYFANIYFGLRQSIEIDSLRFSIEQIPDDYDRQWALGALTATVSKLGTTYAGHFAQPLISGPDSLKLSNLSRVLETRAASVMHEFSIRLLNLSEESEKFERPVEVVNGPWQVALSSLEDLSISGPILVYLDAPYKREEYSRYYHVLETLVTYSYPSSQGVGRTPEKSATVGQSPEEDRGKRFNSEFSSRTEHRVSNHFVNLLTEILTRGWMCAWSYSDSGDADIVSVINQVCQQVSCSVNSFSTPYVHISQSGRPHKQVVEYLIIFQPTCTAKHKEGSIPDYGVLTAPATISV